MTRQLAKEPLALTVQPFAKWAAVVHGNSCDIYRIPLGDSSAEPLLPFVVSCNRVTQMHDFPKRTMANHFRLYEEAE
jgi:hypothetical protein